MHQKTNRILKKNSIYLVDLEDNITLVLQDVTRTISLITKTKRSKKFSTRVLKGHLNLSNFKLKKILMDQF